MGDVWCSQCDQPAIREVLLTTGETVAKCSKHLWLLIAPGQKKGAAK